MLGVELFKLPDYFQKRLFYYINIILVIKNMELTENSTKIIVMNVYELLNYLLFQSVYK